ncbi:MAG TPA: PQQ-binding-like beta-propeller repeat protein [Candidatus Acidoferrales bacterium]|nr:PQQ-binding-like beta-propeller repeat protein [Candidatus Acidoferrales bacterium]
MIKACCLVLVLLLAGAAARVQAQDELQRPQPAKQDQSSTAQPETTRPAQRPPEMLALGPLPHGTVPDYKPVTDEMLLNPSPDDWLQFSRTYDAWRYSPLKQINKKNVGQLHIAWVKGLPSGTTETIPLVHDGVIYTIAPGSDVMAIDATNGDVIWEYKRTYKNSQMGAVERTKALAIYKDMLYYTTPDGYVVALDATNGRVRWETYKTDTQNTSGAIVVEGKVISGGTCGKGRESCFIEADDANTGQKLWRFYNVAGPGDPGYASWNGADNTEYTASTWGLPGNYDPVRKVIYWGTANPSPYERLARHGGNPDGTSRTAPADLYSNCTVALDPATGKLIWYYQHLPADDWDTDHTHERTLVTTTFNPDPKSVKWYNTEVPRGSKHDVAAMVGESGIMFVLDRSNGQFLWAEPVPFDAPNLALSNIDGKTGLATINYDVVMKNPGDHHVICYWNGRSYWPTAYDPETNSLYTGYVDNCLDMTANNTSGIRHGVLREGSDPNAIAGIAKINLSTGEMLRFDTGRSPGTGALLATAGGLIFHGDINRRFRAFDAATGKQLWESILGGPISVSTITYAVHGKQYVMVITGDNLAEPVLSRQSGVDLTTGHNAIYAFALE